VGTGGDSSGSHNLSTGAALLAAAAGAEIVKHGNRSVSSQCGSFDVLGALGLDVPWDAQRAGEVFARTRFTYLFAPSFHPAMKSVAPVRQALGARTISIWSARWPIRRVPPIWSWGPSAPTPPE
jgi:anthranilate phosphoribosyltransferase